MRPWAGVLILSALMGPACNRQPDTLRSDLQRSIARVGQVHSLAVEEARVMRARSPGNGGGSDPESRIIFLPFRADIRLVADMNNYVQHAREGRRQPEYLRWVNGQSRTEDGKELLVHSSLVENLSSEVWYDRKVGEIVSIAGEMRYREEKGSFTFLGVFE